MVEFTSAASAAFRLASSAEDEPPPPVVLPSVRGGPPTFWGGGLDALAGMDAVMGAGGGAESRRRPGEEKWSDSLPQRLPMVEGRWIGGLGCDGGRLSRGGFVAWEAASVWIGGMNFINCLLCIQVYVLAVVAHVHEEKK